MIRSIRPRPRSVPAASSVARPASRESRRAVRIREPRGRAGSRRRRDPQRRAARRKRRCARPRCADTGRGRAAHGHARRRGTGRCRAGCHCAAGPPDRDRAARRVTVYWPPRPWPSRDPPPDCRPPWLPPRDPPVPRSPLFCGLMRAPPFRRGREARRLRPLRVCLLAVPVKVRGHRRRSRAGRPSRRA